MLPPEMRIEILNLLDTRSVMALAKVSHAMKICVPLAKQFKFFNASKMYSIEDEDFDVISMGGTEIDPFVL